MKQSPNRNLFWPFIWKKISAACVLAFFIRLNHQSTLFQQFRNKAPALPCLILFSEINAQPYFVQAVSTKYVPSRTFLWYLVWNKSPTVTYFRIFNKVNTQPYLISLFQKTSKKNKTTTTTPRTTKLSTIVHLGFSWGVNLKMYLILAFQ